MIDFNRSGMNKNNPTNDEQDTISLLRAEILHLKKRLKVGENRIEQLERLADQDFMLPVYNRRAFIRELSRAISLSRRYRMLNSIIYFDINGMKHINDTYGHNAGDAALEHVASSLSSQVRESDLVARLGGDEFGVILYQVDSSLAEVKSIQLSQYISDKAVLFGEKNYNIQVKMGLYTCDGNETACEAIQMADEAMYSRI